MVKTVALCILFSLTVFPCLASDPVVPGNVFKIERIAPVSFTKLSDGTFFADFGKDAFGTLELKYKAASADTLVICLGEKLLNGRIDPKPGGTIRFAEVKLPVAPGTGKYMLKLVPDKRNTSGAAVLLPDSFGVLMPFRYAEIKNARIPVTAADVIQKAYFHRFDMDQSDFTSSDTILNKVWELCKYSIKATSFTGLYIDGDRERIPYEADAYINQLSHYCTDCDYVMGRLTIEHFMKHPTWPTEWLLHTVMLVWQDYCYTGDKSLMEKYYRLLKDKTLEELAREDGLISSSSPKMTEEFVTRLGFANPKQKISDIVDWPPGQKDTGWKLATSNGERDGHEMMPINTVVNCFFYENMKIMAEIAGILNIPSDKAHYEKMAEKVKSTINQKLFDPSKGIYVDGEGSGHSSLHSNMMALAFGIVPEASTRSVADFVKSRGMACSVYGSQYLLEGLYRSGEGQYALDLMRGTGDRSWWNMIRSGSTISLEAWDMKYKPNSDWNHAWGAAPANIIPRWLWGIRPSKAGYDAVTVEPQMGDLTVSIIKVPTRHGPIKGDYSCIPGKVKKFTLEIPPDMTGKFAVPVSSAEAFFLNGKKRTLPREGINLEPGINRIEIRKI